MKIAGIIILSVIGLGALIALSMGLQVGGIKWSGVVNPMKEEVRRNTFEGTRSYNEAKEQQLAKYRLEWMRGDATTKAALESTIRSMFANFDETKLHNYELEQFLTNTRGY